MTYGMKLEALAVPTRRAVFEAIARSPSSVGEIAAALPVSRPAVSQHLAVLKRAGLASEHREGVKRIYSADREGIAELRAWFDRFWDDALDRFADTIEGDGA